MEEKIIYLAIGNEDDSFGFGVDINWILSKNLKELEDIDINTNVGKERIFKGNWNLSQKIYDLALLENALHEM